jgi:hypothetical protein
VAALVLVSKGGVTWEEALALSITERRLRYFAFATMTEEALKAARDDAGDQQAEVARRLPTQPSAWSAQGGR